jgi:hypothetical protein
MVKRGKLMFVNRSGVPPEGTDRESEISVARSHAAVMSSSVFGTSYNDWFMRKVIERLDLFHIFATVELWILQQQQDIDCGTKAMCRTRLETQKSKAVSQLRKRLMRAVADDGAILTTMQLSRLTAGDGDWDMARVKREQLKHIVRVGYEFNDDGARFFVEDM